MSASVEWLRAMSPTTHLIRSMVAGMTALGLALSAVCSPLLMTQCAIAVRAGKAHCCCGENCHCGPSCGEKAEGTEDQQGSPSVERDPREVGKISSATILLAPDFARGPRLIDSRSLVAAVAWPQTLLAQHTFLRI
jgi:hypothetical protein